MWYFELVFHNEDTEDIIIFLLIIEVDISTDEWRYKFMLNICCNNCE
jgi:hypothetical protein